MAPDIEETSLVKQLAANDRPTREKALSSLKTYLTSKPTFTALDLLKIWKGLFFCTSPLPATQPNLTPPPTGVFHTDRPLPQQRLSTSLASLLLPLPTTLFLPFLSAFWTTIISYWTSIQGLRLDKYLYLLRQYIAHSFIYLQQHDWEKELLDGYLDLLEELPLSPAGGKVPDGVRYHVCDVWVDGLVQTEGWEGMGVMRPVERLSKEGRTKVVRGRAKAVLEDERLQEGDGEVDGAGEGHGGEGDFEGFDE